MFVIYLLVGLVLLYYGAEWLVKGSSSIAFSFGMKKMVVGLTVVALGTSMPEFVVSLHASLTENDSVSVGNIVGSNLANILLVLGLSSILNPVNARKSTIYIDMPFLIIITVLFNIFCFDGLLTGKDSLILLLLFVGYMTYQVLNRRDKTISKSELPVTVEGRLLKNIFLSFIGIGALVLGGNLTVKGAVDLAQILGVSNLIIGLTVVAIGTSLPELFTSVVAAIRHEHEISIGNVIGSNLFNIAFVLGIVPLIRPMKISPSVITFDNWFMLGVTVLLGLIVLIRGKIAKMEGILFLLLYLFFILNLIYNFI
ncbi:MAG: calcium/sodium antiporter [Fidelibacterota bacterium]